MKDCSKLMNKKENNIININFDSVIVLQNRIYKNQHVTIFILYIVSTCHNSHNTHELSCLFVAFLSQSDNHCIYG